MSRLLNAALLGAGIVLLAASPAIFWEVYLTGPFSGEGRETGTFAFTLPVMLAGAVLMAGGLLRR